MLEKLTIEDIIIKVMPGGFLLVIMFYLYGGKVEISLLDNFDFLYTFVFFCLAFITGEILQTIAHLSEWMIDVFFKFRRPSKVFLYKNNPVLKSKKKREELLNFLNLSNKDREIFDEKYKNLFFLQFWKINKKNNDISQSLFWKLYTNVCDLDEVKASNRGYLFVRVIMIVFLILALVLFFDNKTDYAIVSSFLFLMFLWRSRGYARGLVFKIVLLNLK